MSKPKVYIARPVPPEVEAYIAKHCDYRKWEGVEPLNDAMMKQEIGDAAGLLTSGGSIDAELLAYAPALKVVSNMAAGYNNMDIPAMISRGIIGTNTPNVLDQSVADLVMGLILATSRRIVELDRYMRAGKWTKSIEPPLFGVDVHQATLGIIGMGRIGEAVARRAKLGFDMEVLYHNRHRKPDIEQKWGYAYRPLEDLLRQSDIVVVLMALTRETIHYIDREQLKLMKPTAFFINASRGKIVNEQALIEALRDGVIRGAGLDVFDREPVGADHPLLRMSQVVAVPHIGSATYRTRYRMAMLGAENLVRALRGERPPNLIEEFLQSFDHNELK